MQFFMDLPGKEVTSKSSALGGWKLIETATTGDSGGTALSPQPCLAGN